MPAGVQEPQQEQEGGEGAHGRRSTSTCDKNLVMLNKSVASRDITSVYRFCIKKSQRARLLLHFAMVGRPLSFASLRI